MIVLSGSGRFNQQFGLYRSQIFSPLKKLNIPKTLSHPRDIVLRPIVIILISQDFDLKYI
jgi:hypothetical protein